MLAVALYKLWQRSSSPQYARIVPSDDYDDLPDLIDTSPPPSPGSSASESPIRPVPYPPPPTATLLPFLLPP